MVTWLPDGENIFKICLLLAACPAGSMPASIVFTQWSKNVFFALQGRHIVPIDVKFGTGKWITGQRSTPMSNFTSVEGKAVCVCGQIISCLQQ